MREREREAVCGRPMRERERERQAVCARAMPRGTRLACLVHWYSHNTPAARHGGMEAGGVSSVSRVSTVSCYTHRGIRRAGVSRLEEALGSHGA